MGAWGSGIFQNDTSLDWVGDFDAEGAEAVARAVKAAMRPGYLDADVASEALAACAVVAAAEGAELPEDAPADVPVKSHAAAVQALKLAAPCQRVVRRVTAEGSELLELWEDAEPADFKAFKASVRELKDRLPQVKPAPLDAPVPIGQPGPRLRRGLDLPVTQEALRDWLMECFQVLEARGEVNLGPLPEADDLTEFLDHCHDRAIRLARALGVTPFDTTVPCDDHTPGGLRAVEMCIGNNFRITETHLNGGVEHD